MRRVVSEYFQRMGRAFAEYALTYRRSFRARSKTEEKTPRAMTSRSILANQSSTWLSHEEYVGVKWKHTMDHARRHALRQQKAPPLLDQIRSHILAMSKTVLPKSAAGQASSYALAIWTRLTHFLDYPELELSNNLAENSMRPIAVGRSNWIHIGSEHAGRKAGRRARQR
jgi:Transposase IS66 family